MKLCKKILKGIIVAKVGVYVFTKTNSNYYILMVNNRFNKYIKSDS